MLAQPAPLVPSPRTGAPYLARFSRDVGFHCSFPLTLDSPDALGGERRWYPISREKRARYGAPVLGEGTRLVLLQSWHTPRFQASYGLKKWSSSSSSCLLSEARTRMCRTMVPEMRGEKPSGSLWQREQFCLKMRSPSSSCCGAAGATVGFLLAG